MRRPAWTTLSTHPLYLLLAGALVALALWGFWPRALPVEAAQVVRGPLTVSFTEEGRTRLRERYLVSAPLDGVIERVMLEPGDQVTAGMPVAVLRPAHAALFDPASRSEARARWRAARDDATAAEAATTAAAALRDRLAHARERAETLAARQLIAADERDAIRAQALAAEAELRSARARAQAARARRDGAHAVLELQGAAAGADTPRLPLAAPVDGRVMRRHVESEGLVRAGQPLLEIGDPQALEIMVEALTADAVRVARGTPVRLLRWGGTEPLQGRVETVEPSGFTKVSALGVEEQRVPIVIALEGPLAPRAALGDGFRVEAQFLVWHADAALTVPVAALFRDGPHWAIYAIDNGHARLRRIRIGHVGETLAEVEAGLSEGAQVVLYPGDSVRDGMRVAPSVR